MSLPYLILAFFDFLVMDASKDQTVSEFVVSLINFSFEHVIFWVKLSPRTALQRALGGKFFILSTPLPILFSASVFPAEQARGATSASAPTAPIFLCLWRGARAAGRPLRLISKHEFYHFTLFSFAFRPTSEEQEARGGH